MVYCKHSVSMTGKSNESDEILDSAARFAAEDPGNAPNVISVAATHDDTDAVQFLHANPGNIEVRLSASHNTINWQIGVPFWSERAFLLRIYT